MSFLRKDLPELLPLVREFANAGNIGKRLYVSKDEFYRLKEELAKTGQGYVYGAFYSRCKLGSVFGVHIYGAWQ
jgi:hypothetical protein